jgi:hypothetical protein
MKTITTFIAAALLAGTSAVGASTTANAGLVLTNGLAPANGLALANGIPMTVASAAAASGLNASDLIVRGVMLPD